MSDERERNRSDIKQELGIFTSAFARGKSDWMSKPDFGSFLKTKTCTQGNSSKLQVLVHHVFFRWNSTNWNSTKNFVESFSTKQN